MEHTFLLQSGVWIASGSYYDEEENRFPFTGESRISRENGDWTIGGHLEVGFPQPVRFYNNYQIPAGQTPPVIGWESHNPSLGRFTGWFLFVEDTIFSENGSDDGHSRSLETMVRVSAYTYQVRGVLFLGGQKASSWAGTLTQQNR